MKITIAQTRPIKGDISKNIKNHLKLIQLAIDNQANSIIFPELSITGYEPDLAKKLATTVDDKRFQVFQTLSNKHKITIGIGVPLKQKKGITISMLLFRPNQFIQIYSKKYLHSDEFPFFESGENDATFIENTNIALAICYEIFVEEQSCAAFENPTKMYLASVAKSVGGIDKAHQRLASIAKKNKVPVLMSNCIGYCDNFESAGRSAIWDSNGELLMELGGDKEGILIFDASE